MSKARPDRKSRSSKLVRKSFALFLRSARGITVFEIFYKLSAYFILFPLLSKVESLILRTSGTAYVTMQNVQSVLLNPLTWIVILLMLLMAYIFTSIEMMGIFRAIHAASCGKQLSAREIFHEGVYYTFHALRSRSLLYPPFVLLLVPATNIIAATTFTRHLGIPGFIMSWIQERPLFNLAFLAVNLGLWLLALMFMYAPSVLATQQVSFREACAQSATFSRKHRIVTAISLLFWKLILLVVVALLAIAAFGAALLIGLWLDPASFHLSESFIDTIMSVEVLAYACIFVWISTPVAFTRLHAGYLYEAERLGISVPQFVPSQPFPRQKILSRILIVCLLVLGFFFIPPRYRLIRFTVLDSTHPIMVMGHRGDSVNAPENTIPAFLSAYENGADAVELDVQMTRDGELIILHDSSLTRTTGLRANVWEVDWNDIRDLDNGSFFDPAFADTRIPRLDDVLKFAHAHDNLFLNIEIKRTGHDDGIEQKVIDAILENDYADHCDITSLDYATLETVRSINPAIRTVYTTVVGLGNVQNLDAADIFSLESVSATGDFIQSLRQLGKGVFVWTLNTEDELNAMIDLGVDAVLTDNVALARELVDVNTGSSGLLSRITRIFSRL